MARFWWRKSAGKLDKAADDFTTILKSNEEDYRAVMGRGYVRFQQKNFKDAVADFGKAIELNPRDAVAWNNRGYNRHQLGQYAQALSDYGNDRFLSHMADEETLLVDLLSDELRSRLLADHEALRSLLDSVRQKLGAASVDIGELAKLAAMWRAHIRWEERQLFPYLETHAPPEKLQLVGDRLRQNVHGDGEACSMTPRHTAEVPKDG